MEIKQKSKITNIFKIIVFTLILLILMLGFNTKSNAAELFWDDVPNLWYNIPRYGNIGPLVFCSKKGYGTAVYMDCSKKIANLLGSGTSIQHYWGFGGTRYSQTYTVLNEDPITKTNYDWTGGAYPIAEKYGPIWWSDTFRSEVSNFISDLVEKGEAHGDNLIGFYVGGVLYTDPRNYYRTYGSGSGLDYVEAMSTGEFDMERIKDPSIGLPMYVSGYEGRPPLYSVQFDTSESFADTQVQAALYINSEPGVDDYTKQQALWGLKSPYIYNQGNVTGGNALTQVACMYENMYKKLTEIMKGGMTCGEAYLSTIKSNTKDVKRIEKVDIENKDYDLYVYDKIVWNVNKDEKAYYLGPFSIDYSVVGSPDPRCVAYDYIKDVTVYNQDKKNISELGGSFEILDEYGNTIYSGNKEDLKKITPQMKFYIKVNMGSMEAKDFESFYAKFDFKYICKIEGAGAQRYKATVNKWGYVSQFDGFTTYSLSGYYDYKYKVWVGAWKTKTVEDPETGETSEESYYDSYDHQEERIGIGGHHASTKNISGLTYTLVKGVAGEYAGMAQDQTHLDGERVWDEQSIVITTDWEPIDVEVDIEKICSETGKPLYGAEFNIKLDIQGTDAFGNTINKQLEFTRTTDSDGIARLPREEIEAMGVDLSTFRGTINVTATETYAPAGHTVTQEVYTGSLSSGTLTIRAEDKETEGVIKLAKVDQNGNYIDADFEVVVMEEGKDYPSIQNHKIKGSTENGVMYISREDLRTVGIDIDNFTGNLVLEIVEVRTKNGYSIKSQGKTVTLTFENGELKEYNETDAGLTVEYLFDDALQQALTDFVEGKKTLEELPEWVRNNIQEWINKQLAREDLDMEYNEVMDWFKKYVEEQENKKDIFKGMTESSSQLDNGMLQITVENDPGMELPDIPPTTIPPDDLTLRVAGYAFLDGTETKGQEYNTNGELDPGEILLGGIKVTLKESNGADAELIQSSKGDDIRTNPTMTNENGYYEFRGVDPLKDYYVEFEYNGIKYEASPGSVTTYNSDKWAITAKASETDSSARSQYNTVTPTTKVYSYEELEGIYNAIQAYTLNYIMTNNSYPSDSQIRSGVKQYVNSGEMNDIDDRLDYILSGSVVKARAGYGAGDSGTYPHSSRKEFLTNRELVNMDKETYEFMKEEIERLYPGQLQIHLGLKERDRTDLSLRKDIVESELDINGHKTVYKYENGSESYTEYIYEEDYRYDDEEKQNTNIAYYDDITAEQEPQLYITYKITVTNEMTQNTRPLEIVDYFDPNFEVVGAWIGGNSISYSATSAYGKNPNKQAGNDAYSAVYLTPGVTLSKNSVDITLKLKLKDAKNNLTKYIKTEKGESIVSKAWEVENFAEINAYSTDGSYIDIDSHPGDLSIANFKQALADYRQAFSDFMNTMSESAGLAAQAARDRLLEAREDDAWEVSLTLINNGLKRELDGSVWEAISDEIKTASNLQETDTLLQYVQDHGVEGITVELLELRDFGSEAGNASDTGDVKVRARTSTDSNGNYHFESYIPGNYVIRFTYGDKENPIRSEFTKDSEEKFLQINGQFYQSTKANPNTDAQEYWYAQDTGTRYSDAQDGAQSRANQIEAEIKGSTNSKSNNYNYTGIVSIDSGVHQDAINAYTSSIHAEGEYTKQEIQKAFSMNNADYNYEIENVDFGITPRAGVDLQIDKYVSNIKVYLQDKTLQLDCSFDYEEDEDGNKRIKADGVHYNTTPETEELVNLVIANYGSTSFLDGLIEVLMDDQLYNGAQLEVTYTISVDNKSEYDTLRWVINNGTKVGVVYYQNEDYTKLPNYEQGKVIYQSDADQKFIKTTGTITPDSERIVKTSAVNIVDYVEPNLQFRKTNFLGEAINEDWVDTNKDEFISSRKDYGDVMSGYSESVKSEYDKLTSVYNQYIKAADGSKLLDELEPRNTEGERMDSYRDTTLTLVTTLGTTASDTTDYEYHNLVEIAQMANTSGRVKKVEYYDVDGKLTSSDTYKEEDRKKDDDKIPYLPTIGTSKSETVVFHAPTGLPVSESIQTNVIIALVALVTLAGGIVLIKKYAVKTKQE